jgi:anti-anti-sigma factor
MRLGFWLGFPFRLARRALSSTPALPPQEQAGTPDMVSPPTLTDTWCRRASPLEIEVVETAEGVVVRLRGEAGVTEASVLDASLLRLVARRPVCVTFDLRELWFISSLAIGVLTAYRSTAVRTGTRVCLAPDVHPGVREALDIAEVMNLFETTRQARPGAGRGPGAEDTQKLYPSVQDVQRAYGVTWAELVEVEPLVEELLGRARLAAASCRTFLDVDRGFVPLRNELAALIGFAGKHHRHPVLGSAGAYEVAYWTLYDAVTALVPEHASGAAEATDNQRGGTAPEPCPS